MFSSCRSSSSSGFTLFETLIAVLIIAFLTLTAIGPFRQAQQNFLFDSIAYRVRSELHRIRVLAIVRNEDCRFRVTSPTTYVVECQTPGWVTLDTHQVPRDFLISANNAPEFHPGGNVGPMGTIRVWNPDGDQKRVIVSRSGRVRTE
jgi:hypothetical protein